MPGITPNEGESLVGQVFYKSNTANRTGLQLALITNVAPGETLTYAQITEPAGAGYGRVALADANWVDDNAGGFTFPAQVFTAGANWTGGAVTGYAILSTGAAPKVVHVEIDANGPYTMNTGATYTVNLNNAVA